MRSTAFFLVLMWPAFAVSAFAQSDVQMKIGGGKIDIALTPSPAEPLRQLVLRWVTSSARAVTVYYKQFPVAHLQIQIRFFDGRGIRSGQTFGENGALIRISVGRSNTSADFADDWMMTHEMVHLAFPSVAPEHHWIEEGSATYIEPIARSRTGDLTPEKVWGDLVDGLPQGLPEPNDRGLDFTPTWGRTYWGGALFCFLADIEIRKRTGNQKGLEHALRGILKSGGTIESEWPLARALEVADQATGVPVLRELYEKMKAAPAPVDLKALWQQLGVEKHAGKTKLNDAAPLALIRKAITASGPPARSAD